MDAGCLVLVATPIGNLGDLTDRARRALAEADYWIVEDTRVSGKLQSYLTCRKPMRVLNDHTGLGIVERYFREIGEGARVALLTDGGSPSISDPGAALADKCLDAGIQVDAIPGPSAVTTALSASGFFGQRFVFLGFLGRKEGAIRSDLEPFAESPLTIVLFESPFRVSKLLATAFTALGPRRYAICRELTKAHQQVFRERLPAIPDESVVPRKGEVTIVIEGLRRGEAKQREARDDD